jgi:transcription initiation factor IIE alpha subunit
MCDVVDKDFARQLERELNELWSRFDKQMEAEAEVERLKRPYGCKCQTLRERALGDGCDECNKALVIEMLTDERDELEAEVERLEANLKRAIEIAERLRSKIFTDGWLDEDDELYQIKATLNPTDK